MAPPRQYSVVWSAGIEKKWHYRWCNVVPPVVPRGTTWHHCCTTVVPRCTTVVPPVMPLWHNKEKILHQWCYNGTTGSATWHHRGATVVPSGATWCNRWHHIAPPVVPLFFYACRPYNRVRTGWCNQILVWSVEQTRFLCPKNLMSLKKL